MILTHSLRQNMVYLETLELRIFEAPVRCYYAAWASGRQWEYDHCLINRKRKRSPIDDAPPFTTQKASHLTLASDYFFGSPTCQRIPARDAKQAKDWRRCQA